MRYALEIDRLSKLIIPLNLPHVYGKFLLDCQQSILDTEMAREKPLSDDHVKQLAVQWAKKHKDEMEKYWKEWRQPKEDNSERV